jgi:hypothetical protein
MRIDGVSPIVPAGSGPEPRVVKPAPVPTAAAPEVKDHLETHSKPEVGSTNVVVEMQPGNIVIYKFIDSASGRLIQQIPAEEMLNLSQPVESARDKKRS